jgi:hypothetical protein
MLVCYGGLHCDSKTCHEASTPVRVNGFYFHELKVTSQPRFNSAPHASLINPQHLKKLKNLKDLNQFLLVYKECLVS